MEIVTLIAAVFIGFSLGLIGGGGSILTVPVFVYLGGIAPVQATAYSLFVVGVAALAGAFSYMRKGLLDYKTAVVFALPSLTAVFLTRKFIVPAIPENMGVVAGIEVTRGLLLMVFFGVIMVAASVSMIRKKKEKASMEDEEPAVIKFNYPMILLEGAVVGVVTGLVGAGGGFLIVPALVLLARLPIKLAIGTSLLIISAKSLIGFTGDLGHLDIDWPFLLLFTLIATSGIFAGSYFTKFISSDKLKTGFGYFVLVLAVVILTQELILK